MFSSPILGASMFGIDVDDQFKKLESIPTLPKVPVKMPALSDTPVTVPPSLSNLATQVSDLPKMIIAAVSNVQTEAVQPAA
jgi:hypothetical protein